MHICSAVGRVLHEANYVLNDLLLKLIVAGEHITASFSNKVYDALICLSGLVSVLLEGLVKDEEGNREELVRGIAKWLQRAHKAK